MNIESEKNLMLCLVYYDFERVHKAMEALNWKWSSADGVPSIDELKEQAVDLLIRCFQHSEKNKEDWIAATGGFEASSYYKEDGEIDFELKFVI